MFCTILAATLTIMSQHSKVPPLTWSKSELALSELLPTGTATLLLADVEAATRLWETQPQQKAPALAHLNQTINETIAAHDGVQPLTQGEGDSFVAAFTRVGDALSCALALQRTPLAPIRLRIGVHTGEVQLRDGTTYVGPTINRAARLRDLAHGGQIVLSGTTEPLIEDQLPDGAWLTDLGSYPLRDLPRLERVVQLCHPGLRNEFPPLRISHVAVSHHLPVQLTSFVGRRTEMAELYQILTRDRLVTLIGTGGAGKTRLAVEVSSQLTAEFGDGIWYIDLAPISNSVVVPTTVARTLGLPDQPGRSTIDVLIRFVGQKTALLVLDNCEHLLDVCGTVVVKLLEACPHLTILTTSREPLGVSGELSWLVPPLSLVDEATALFIDRAYRANPEFAVAEDTIGLVEEICRRLDGMPLAIELAAARVRTLSLHQIMDSLHDRFRLLTGGARTAVRRQQTLRASVDWSHALLTEPEQTLFRRLAVFAGGFDCAAAQAIGADSEVQRGQLLDQLSLLVDKSLVIADETSDGVRYRLLETVRQYAQQILGESGEADEVRTRHRNYYTATAAEMESPGHSGDEQLLRWAQTEIDNLRAAFAWSWENAEFEMALRLVLSLRPLWLRGGHVLEALTGLDAVLADKDNSGISPAVWTGAVAYQGILSAWAGIPADRARAQQALAIARQLDDPALIAQALIACGMLAIYDAEVAQQYFAEAIDLVRTANDLWSLCQIFSYQAIVGILAGEPAPAQEAAEEGRVLADALGDGFFLRNCRVWLGTTLMMQGDLTQAIQIHRAVVDEAEAAADLTVMVFGHVCSSIVLACQGQAAAARTAAQSAHAAADTIGGIFEDLVYSAFAYAALADGDATTARRAAEEALRRTVSTREGFTKSVTPLAETALACGDLATAHRWADETVAVAPSWWQMNALTIRAYVAMAQGKPDQAEHDVQAALKVAAYTQGYLRVDDTLECLARLAAENDNHPDAVRLLGAAEAIRERLGHPRFAMYQAGYDAACMSVREALGQNDFEAGWTEGAALSTEEAIAYAQHGRRERKRLQPAGIADSDVAQCRSS